MTQHITIEDADLVFENKRTKVIANYDEPEIELAGCKVGPFKEGREYEIRFWIARILEEKGIIRFREEDLLNIGKLHKIHWMEIVQHSNKASPLPENFYPQLRRLLTQLESPKNKSEKLKDLEKSIRISQDVINCRVKKIVSLASSLPLNSHALQNLTPEERTLYYCLNQTINDWRKKILARGENNGRS